MRRGVSILLVPAILVWLYGCATIVNHTQQQVFLQSDPPGATAIIDNVTRVQTPATIKLKRGKDHLVAFEKEHYEQASVVIDHEMSGWIWGNLAFGGLIGLAVDFTTGGAYKLEPDTVSVTLKPKKE